MIYAAPAIPLGMAMGLALAPPNGTERDRRTGREVALRTGQARRRLIGFERCGWPKSDWRPLDAMAQQIIGGLCHGGCRAAQAAGGLTHCGRDPPGPRPPEARALRQKFPRSEHTTAKTRCAFFRGRPGLFLQPALGFEGTRGDCWCWLFERGTDLIRPCRPRMPATVS